MKSVIRKLIPGFLLEFYHLLMVFLGATVFRFPSRRIKVIGVTGTNGKSTVIELIDRIFDEAGHKTASLSSIRFKIAGQERPNRLKMTMPGRFTIQKFLKEAADAGCQYAILEVTSEGIKQHRHRFIDFTAAVFTNLTPEHIEAHGGFENYRAAKIKLFQAVKDIHIINIDDKNADYFLKIPSKIKYVYSIGRQQFPANPAWKTVRAENVAILKDGVGGCKEGMSFTIKGTSFNIKLAGEFNIYNALAAICAGLSQGIKLEICKDALEKIIVIPGRMELVIEEPFKVFVDYAFTPSALEQVYQTLKPENDQKSKLICVLGACGGGRDKWKRPVLGEIAIKHCDKIIVTNEDPYDEDPMEIINQVVEGTKGKAEKILDRRDAIRYSLQAAEKDDVVVITGKGCEPWICLASGKKVPWDDRQAVKEEFSKISKKYRSLSAK